jgi:hypothetical protein
MNDPPDPTMIQMLARALCNKDCAELCDWCLAAILSDWEADNVPDRSVRTLR